jgi:hypothetical protein
VSPIVLPLDALKLRLAAHRAQAAHALATGVTYRTSLLQTVMATRLSDLQPTAKCAVVGKQTHWLSPFQCHLSCCGGLYTFTGGVVLHRLPQYARGGSIELRALHPHHGVCVCVCRLCTLFQVAREVFGLAVFFGSHAHLKRVLLIKHVDLAIDERTHMHVVPTVLAATGAAALTMAVVAPFDFVRRQQGYEQYGR